MTIYNYTTDVTETVNDYVVWGPGGGDIYNVGAGITIDGRVYGALVVGAGDTINIDGTVRGQSYAVGGYSGSVRTGGIAVSIGTDGTVIANTAIDMEGLANRIQNDGHIDGDFYSIIASGNRTSIINNGSIYSHNIAIGIDGTTTIVNSGIINGKSGAILGSDSQETISNTGGIYGVVALYGGNDTFISTTGLVYGLIDAGNGNDTIYGGRTRDVLDGGAGSDRLYGNLGNDKIHGMTGNDIIDGGGGIDSLFGAQGRDRLTGGIGSDNFIFDTAASVRDRDVITDFSHAQHDHILIDKSVFSSLPGGYSSRAALHIATTVHDTAAHDADDRFIYNTVTGALYYDSDGTGHAARIQIATLSNHAALHASDFLIV